MRPGCNSAQWLSAATALLVARGVHAQVLVRETIEKNSPLFSKYCVQTYGYGRVDGGTDCIAVATAKEEAMSSATDIVINNYWMSMLAYTMNGYEHNDGTYADAKYSPCKQYATVDLTGKPKSSGYVEAYFEWKISHIVGVNEGVWSCDPNAHFTEIPLLPGANNPINVPRFTPEWVPCPPEGAGCKAFYDGCDPRVVLLKQVKEVQGDDDQNVGDPIGVIEGHVLVEEGDVRIPAPGVALDFGRAYESGIERTNGPLGARWTHLYDVRLTATNTVFNGTNNAWRVLHTSFGRHFWFQQNTNTGTYSSPFDNNYELRATNGGYQMTIPARAIYSFDTNGVLQQVRDLFNNTLTLTYSNAFPTQLLTKVEHSSGKTLTFSYTSNLLSRVDTPSTNLSVLFCCNAIGELTGVIRRLSSGDLLTSYAYDYATNYCNHSLTQRVNAAGRTFAWAYATNEGGQITSRAIRTYSADGTNVFYDTILSPNTNLNLCGVTYVRNNTNLVYEYVYSPVLRKVRAVYGPNWTNPVDWKGIRYELDDYGNATSTLTADWTLLDWTRSVKAYDGKHHVTNRASAYKATPTNFWHYLWDTNSQTLTSITDPEGHKIQYEHTNGLITMARLVSSTNETYNTTYSYTSNGLLTAITNASGRYVRYSYDSYGNRTQIIPWYGPTITLDYDALGHVKKVDLPGQSGTRSIVLDPDELGRYRSITYPDGLQETFSYDGAGNLLTNVDRAGRVTRRTYHKPSAKLASITRLLQSGGSNQEVTISLDYDTLYNTLHVTDPLGRAVETYQYDDQNRLVKIINLETQEMTITYGVGRMIKTITRFDGTAVSNSYDTDGRLAKQVFPGITNTFTYYRNNLLKTAANAAGIISNEFNTINRLISSSGAVPSGEVLYAYYPAGEVSNVTSAAWSTTYFYDPAAPQGSFSFTYNTNNGLLASMSYSNGILCTYAYDVMDRLTNITWTGPQTNLLRSLLYAYNSVGLITQKVANTGGELRTENYAYDSLDRLTGERYYDSQGRLLLEAGYGYDLAGNRVSKTGNGYSVAYSLGVGNRLAGWTLSGTGSAAWLDVRGYSSEAIGTNDSFGQLSVSNLTAVTPAVSGTNFWADALPMGSGTQKVTAAIRDAAGNVGYATNTVVMKIATNGSYQYDAAGNVTNISYVGSGFSEAVALAWDGQYRLTSAYTNGALAESCTYDAFGRRISITCGTNTAYLVYDRIHCVAEVDAEGRPLRSYVYGPGIDNILAMRVYSGGSTTTYYYLKDHLGSVAAVADSGGSIVEQYRYDAWGRVSVFDGSGKPISGSVIGNRFLFQGREYSWVTGLYYFRARWYDPVTGRWLSNDPLGILGGLNQYLFCANNPIGFVDPFGLVEDPRYPYRPKHALLVLGGDEDFLHALRGQNPACGSPQCVKDTPWLIAAATAFGSWIGAGAYEFFVDIWTSIMLGHVTDTYFQDDSANWEQAVPYAEGLWLWPYPEGRWHAPGPWTCVFMKGMGPHTGAELASGWAATSIQ